LVRITYCTNPLLPESMNSTRLENDKEIIVKRKRLKGTTIQSKGKSGYLNRFKLSRLRAGAVRKYLPKRGLPRKGLS
ncbi:MAG TPA: hypothetical protein VN416_00810, partial [Desulfomonilia bacterium]|nr:hypothetical protein [Desulfomonilia bacterium]